jgi:hypothetical protein
MRAKCTDPVVPSTTMPRVSQGGDGGDSTVSMQGQAGQAAADEEEEEDEGPTCSVCLEPYDRQDPPVHLKCSCSSRGLWDIRRPFRSPAMHDQVPIWGAGSPSRLAGLNKVAVNPLSWLSPGESDLFPIAYPQATTTSTARASTAGGCSARFGAGLGDAPCAGESERGGLCFP